MAAVATQILAAVEAGLKAAFPDYPVAVRKHAEWFTGDPAAGQVVVSMDGKEKYEQLDGQYVMATYPVTVSLFRAVADDSKGRAEHDPTRDFRQAVRRAFDGTSLAGCPTVSSVDPEPGDGYETQPTRTVVGSHMNLAVQSREPRNG